MKLLDLFSGIGGFSLAAHQLGWQTIGFVEWDKYNQKVLAKNFPNTPIHGDINTYHGTLHEADIITGGFPCQPFSTAGLRQGTNDGRYLWPEMLRIVREVQPTYVIGENVAGIYSMDDGSVFEQVCTDLENEGYSVQPFRIPACATGAPHRRDRWWFVAHAESKRSRKKRDNIGRPQERGRPRSTDGLKNSATANSQEAKRKLSGGARAGRQGFANDNFANPNTCQKRLEGGKLDRALIENNFGEQASRSATEFYKDGIAWPQVAARLCRVDDGLPAWVDRHRTNRLKSLGNSIQPQVAFKILKGIESSF